MVLTPQMLRPLFETSGRALRLRQQRERLRLDIEMSLGAVIARVTPWATTILRRFVSTEPALHSIAPPRELCTAAPRLRKEGELRKSLWLLEDRGRGLTPKVHLQAIKYKRAQRAVRDRLSSATLR